MRGMPRMTGLEFGTIQRRSEIRNTAPISDRQLTTEFAKLVKSGKLCIYMTTFGFVLFQLGLICPEEEKIHL